MRILILPVVLAALAVPVPAPAQTYSEWISRANAQYEAQEYEKSGASFDQAFAVESGAPRDWYNAACSWALAGYVDEAFAALDGAIERGYRDIDLLNRDTDLGTLHSDSRWDAVVSRCHRAYESYLETVNVELLEMFQADQADRRGDIDWSVVTPRDEARRKRTLELVESDSLSAPDDFVHAAFIFQHGADSTSYRMAHDLAMKAVALDSTYTRARRIAAAAKDRYLHSIGSPQIYGTQYRRVDGVWTMEPMDTNAVTDAERARWGVPPLREQRARLQKMNG